MNDDLLAAGEKCQTGGLAHPIAAIAGSVAEAYWGVPEKFIARVKTYLEPQMLQVLGAFVRESRLMSSHCISE